MGLFSKLFGKMPPDESTGKSIEIPTRSGSQPAEKASLSNFGCYYLYGFTNNPFKQSNDFQSFGGLYKNVIGANIWQTQEAKRLI
jgi:hypothetical protein